MRGSRWLFRLLVFLYRTWYHPVTFGQVRQCGHAPASSGFAGWWSNSPGKSFANAVVSRICQTHSFHVTRLQLFPRRLTTGVCQFKVSLIHGRTSPFQFFNIRYHDYSVAWKVSPRSKKIQISTWSWLIVQNKGWVFVDFGLKRLGFEFFHLDAFQPSHPGNFSYNYLFSRLSLYQFMFSIYLYSATPPSI